MKRFTRLFLDLDATNRTSEKQAALERYFREAPPADAAWALFFLRGGRVGRAITWPQLRDWGAAEADVPGWLLDECYDNVGDLAETIALLLPETGADADVPLHVLVEERIVAMAARAEAERRATLVATWRQLGPDQRHVWNKLITGAFRIGVSRGLVARAVATVAAAPVAQIEQRLAGAWSPSAAAYVALTDPAGARDPLQPYPFLLAHPLDVALASLGEPSAWQAEWKWDGIRAQVLHRGGAIAIWSRGEENVTAQFPEVATAAAALPDGTVLDGEILGWRDDRPLPFAALQRRLGRKRLEEAVLRDVPVSLLAYDLLEAGGEDIRAEPLEARRARLEALLAAIGPSSLRLAPIVPFATWEALPDVQAQARAHVAEGLMLKRRASSYGVGRPRGDWWKWKVEPYTMDAVLMYAQQGSGKRAGLFTDYTFGVWDGVTLVPIAKAYSGLSDAEIRTVDAFIRKNTTERIGPVRVVPPAIVCEIAFEAIAPSPRHKSGIAVRFPRIARLRDDKKPADADTLERVRALLHAVGHGGTTS